MCNTKITLMLKAFIVLILICTLILILAQLYKKLGRKNFLQKHLGAPANELQVKLVSSIDYKRKAHIISYNGDSFLFISGGPNDLIIKTEKKEMVLSEDLGNIV